jgi:hypothetical protein
MSNTDVSYIKLDLPMSNTELSYIKLGLPMSNTEDISVLLIGKSYFI